jgi:hypothetical protein
VADEYIRNDTGTTTSVVHMSSVMEELFGAQLKLLPCHKGTKYHKQNS